MSRPYVPPWLRPLCGTDGKKRRRSGLLKAHKARSTSSRAPRPNMPIGRGCLHRRSTHIPGPVGRCTIPAQASDRCRIRSGCVGDRAEPGRPGGYRRRNGIRCGIRQSRAEPKRPSATKRKRRLRPESAGRGCCVRKFGSTAEGRIQGCCALSFGVVQVALNDFTVAGNLGQSPVRIVFCSRKRCGAGLRVLLCG